MQNAGPNLANPTDEEMVLLKKSCKLLHDGGVAIIASIMGRNREEWHELSSRVVDAGVDAIELNLSCPAKSSTIEESLGYQIGQSAELSEEATTFVKEISTVPVIVKLTPNVSNIVNIAKAVKKSGADAVSAINTVQGIIGVDVETGIPYCSHYDGRSYISGLSGPLIRPIGLRCVAEIAKNVDIPICGIGGIDSWSSAAEYIMLGCSTVQLCSAVMWKGFHIAKIINEGLVNFMERKGFNSIEDFRGSALHFITSEEVDRVKVKARVNKEACNGCGLCVVPCHDAQYDAITLKNREIEIDEAACGGCGLCKVICKREAIDLVKVD